MFHFFQRVELKNGGFQLDGSKFFLKKNGWKSPFPSIKKNWVASLEYQVYINSLKLLQPVSHHVDPTKQAMFCLVADILDSSLVFVGCRKLGWQPPIRGYVKKKVRQNEPGCLKLKLFFFSPEQQILHLHNF